MKKIILLLLILGFGRIYAEDAAVVSVANSEAWAKIIMQGHDSQQISEEEQLLLASLSQQDILNLITAMGGRGVGNGGDSTSQEFVSFGKSLAPFLAGKDLGDQSLYNRLIQVVDSTLVISTQEDLFLKGVEKEALNFPTQKMIMINANAWNNLSNSQKMALAYHEYLGILKVDDQKYQLSSKILELEVGEKDLFDELSLIGDGQMYHGVALVKTYFANGSSNSRCVITPDKVYIEVPFSGRGQSFYLMKNFDFYYVTSMGGGFLDWVNDLLWNIDQDPESYVLKPKITEKKVKADRAPNFSTTYEISEIYINYPGKSPIFGRGTHPLTDDGRAIVLKKNMIFSERNNKVLVRTQKLQVLDNGHVNNYLEGHINNQINLLDRLCTEAEPIN